MAWPKPAKGTAGSPGAPEGATAQSDDVKARGVGATLREARERRGWAIADAAAYLRIRASVLEAMEAGRFETLPTGAYALGFVRTYADFLGLDREEIIRRVKAEAAAVAAPAELSFPQPITESRLPSGVVIAVSALIAIAAYGVWYYQSSTTVALPRVEAVPERLAALVDKPPATNSTTQAEAATPNPVPAAEPPAATTQDGASQPPADSAAAVNEPNAPAAPPAPAASPAPPPEQAQVAAVPPVVAPAPPSAGSSSSDASRTPPPAAPKQYGETEGSRIMIRATADSWVQVRDAAGSVVFSRILRPGDSYAAPNRAGYKLATGNAGVLEITVDGQKAPAIGRAGFTRKDVVLDPARVLAGTAAPPEPVYQRPAAAPAPSTEAQPGPANGG